MAGREIKRNSVIPTTACAFDIRAKAVKEL